MSLQLIPVDNAPNQTWQVTVKVNGLPVPLQIALRYNEVASYWVMTIKDQNGKLLLDSVPFITGVGSAQNILGQYAYLTIGSAALFSASGIVGYPNNLNLGSDFLLLWADQPIPPARTVLSIPRGVGPPASPGGGAPGPTVYDMLDWMLMSKPNRLSFHLHGTGGGGSDTYSTLDTDNNYPVGFPLNTFFWVKHPTGNPWDIEKYDNNYAAKHWITEDGDAVDAPACAAAGYVTASGAGNCWLDPYAYKRFPTPVPIIPRQYTVGGGPVVINTPGPNSFFRTTNCESSSAVINLGDVQAITTGPFNMTWGGSIDGGAGGGKIDNVNGVPTMRNDYYYGGTISSGIFNDMESTFYVKGYGRVAWFFYKLSGGVYQLQQTSINNILTAGIAPPIFPCAPKPWWV